MAGMEGPWPTLAAAAIIGVGGAAIILLAVAADLPRRAQAVLGLRIALALAAPSVCLGLGVFLLMQHRMEDPSRLAAGATAFAGLLALALHGVHAAAAARVRRSLAELATTLPTDPAVIARLVSDLPRVRPPRTAGPARKDLWVRVVFEAAQRMMLQGAFLAALQLLSRIPDAWLRHRQATVRDNSLALCKMRLGDFEGARAALTRGESDAHPDDRSTLETTRAMLLLLEDKPADALAIVGTDRFLDARTRLALLITRAHAHAALGDEGAAKSTLADVTALIGRDGLTRALRAYPGAAAKLV